MDSRLAATLSALATAIGGAVVRHIESLGTAATNASSQESYKALLQALIQCTNHQ